MYVHGYMQASVRQTEGTNLTIKKSIDEFAEQPSSATMNTLISHFREPSVPDECIAHLAMRLAQSGEVLIHPTTYRTADVPSTGGPSSLSTLLCPLELVAAGAKVPKLGVPGRPAGGIDVLACIPNFNSTLDSSQVRSCLQNCGYANFLAGSRFAPLDALLFAHRQKVGAQDVATLAIASLLSKKLAVGVTNVTLDIRVASFTNFGTWDTARANGHRFISVAAQLGISATCLLTDCSVPNQGHLGRGESLNALKIIFDGDATGDLLSHMRLCHRMAEGCLRQSIDTSVGRLYEIFCSHLEQQGATREGFEGKVHKIRSEPKVTIEATSEGFIEVDLDSIRRILTAYQVNHKTENDPFPDPCGIVVVVNSGSAVCRGDIVAEVRASHNLGTIAAELGKQLHTSELPPSRRAPEQIE
jgi:pyrimidine-nucleoside phosphorylase